MPPDKFNALAAAVRKLRDNLKECAEKELTSGDWNDDSEAYENAAEMLDILMAEHGIEP